MGRRLATTERLEIHRPSARDAGVVIAASRRSRDLHHPWVLGPTDVEAWAGYLRRLRMDRHYGFLLRTRDTHAVAGIVNVSDVIMGSFRSGHLSYYAFSGHEGRGLMTEGVSWVVGHAFDHLGLHRLEANVQPGNDPSLRLAERCGFRKEGFSPRYLHIDGDWRDHERWALTKEDRPD